MKKKFMKTALVAVFCLTAGYTAYNAQNKNEKLSDVMLENVEALANAEYNDDGYNDVREDTITIRDDKTNTYKKVIIKTCEGKGPLDC